MQESRWKCCQDGGPLPQAWKRMPGGRYVSCIGSKCGKQFLHFNVQVMSGMLQMLFIITDIPEPGRVYGPQCIGSGAHTQVYLYSYGTCWVMFLGPNVCDVNR
jgi:hypothetical protein